MYTTQKHAYLLNTETVRMLPEDMRVSQDTVHEDALASAHWFSRGGQGDGRSESSLRLEASREHDGVRVIQERLPSTLYWELDR